MRSALPAPFADRGSWHQHRCAGRDCALCQERNSTDGYLSPERARLLPCHRGGGRQEGCLPVRPDTHRGAHGRGLRLRQKGTRPGRGPCPSRRRPARGPRRALERGRARLGRGRRRQDARRETLRIRAADRARRGRAPRLRAGLLRPVPREGLRLGDPRQRPWRQPITRIYWCPRSILEADGFVQKTKDETGQCFYLCENEHGDRMPIRATEWKSAKAAGWQKLYNFEDGQRRTMKQAKAEGLGTKDRTSKRPVQMHRREGQSAYAVGREEMDEVREAWAKIANRHLAAAAAAAGVVPQVIDHRSNKERGLAEEPTIHEGGVGLIGHADRVKQNDEIRARNERLRVLRAELRQEGAELERLRDEVAALERQRNTAEQAWRVRPKKGERKRKAALAKRRRVAMATAAAAVEAQQRVTAATADQTDTKAEMLGQLDEQIAALDEQIRELQRGGAPAALGASLRKAAELAVERKRLADERDRLAGGMAQAESPELEPEDGHRRGPRR
nr:putative mobilisation protein [uncultured bacterium]